MRPSQIRGSSIAEFGRQVVHQGTRSAVAECMQVVFYVKYPQICATASHKLQGIDFLPEKMAFIEKKLRGSICETVSRKFETPPELLVTRLSFSRVSKLSILTQVHRKVHRKSM